MIPLLFPPTRGVSFCKVSCPRDSAAGVCVCALFLAGLHHDRVPAPELARRPPVLQSHQQDAGPGQPIRGQAVGARHLHRQRQIRLVPRCHRGEQAHSPPAQRSHSIQQPVRTSKIIVSTRIWELRKLSLLSDFFPRFF